MKVLSHKSFWSSAYFYVGLVVIVLCMSYSNGDKGYRAAVLQNSSNYDSLVYEAGTKGVDILVIPHLEPTTDSFEETKQSLAEISKRAGLYLVTSLDTTAVCENGTEIVSTSLVFDRKGNNIATYQKPYSASKCTQDLVTFTTDFGVTFGLLTEEDLMLNNLEELKNYVVTSKWPDTIISAPQFLSSWSYTTQSNLICSRGIFTSKPGTTQASLVVADLKEIGYERSVPVMVPTTGHFSDHVTKTVDMKLATQGFKETVCHGAFCCEFYIKTTVKSKTPELSYAVAAFEGLHSFGSMKIGVQNCAVFACAGVDAKSCNGLTPNNTNIFFEKVSITANFTKENTQYPFIQTTSEVPTNKFKFFSNIEDHRQVTLDIVDVKNVYSVAIFGRDFSKDFKVNSGENDVYDIILEDVQEFFDYLWIRLRVLLVVVSIYILEML